MKYWGWKTLLYGGTQWFDSSVPFLLFTFHTKTHKLQNSKYLKPLNKVTEKLHEEIFRLKSLALGYRKIHKKLVKKGYKIGKSPSTVNSIIEKRLKRDKFLNMKVFEEYRDFRIHFYLI